VSSRALRITRTALRFARRILFSVLGIVAVALVAANLFRHPRADRDWEPDWERSPAVASFDGNAIVIENFRDFRWDQPNVPSRETWSTETFNLDELVAADFIVEPFGAVGAAHTMLSFEFRPKDGGAPRHVVISMETRRERGEPFSTWKGLFNQYELAYVIGSEEDLVALRAVARGHELYRYPLKATPPALRDLFAGMALTADSLRAAPEFYGTLWNSCTTRIVMHAEEATGVSIPLSWRYVLPGFSGELAYDLGLVGDGATSFAELEEKAKIGQKARDAYGAAGFSARIRD
jgi:hypothetical protein